MREDKGFWFILLQLKPTCKTCNVINLETTFINKKDLQYDSVNISSYKDESSQISDISISGKELIETLKVILQQP